MLEVMVGRSEFRQAEFEVASYLKDVCVVDGEVRDLPTAETVVEAVLDACGIRY